MYSINLGDALTAAAAQPLFILGRIVLPYRYNGRGIRDMGKGIRDKG